MGEFSMSRLRMISWNVNGIRAVHKKGAFEWFAQEQPEIFCIQETKAHQDQLSPALTKIDGYAVYFAEAERKGYSGVAVYTKIAPTSVRTGFGIERFDSEGRTLIQAMRAPPRRGAFARSADRTDRCAGPAHALGRQYRQSARRVLGQGRPRRL